MALRKLTYALAAAGMIIGTTANAAPVARDSSAVAGTEQLSGDSGVIAVVVGILAILSIILFDNDDDPASP